MPKTSLGKELQSVRRELKEEHDWRMHLHDQVQDLEKKNLNLQTGRVWAARSLLQERADLQSRIDRINLRLASLGFEEQAGFGGVDDPSTVNTVKVKVSTATWVREDVD